MAEHALLAPMRTLLAERLGLQLPPGGPAAFTNAMRAAARELGHADAESAMRALLGSPPGRRELEVLASHLTVGETFFLREPQAFELLQSELLPQIVRARERGERRLRLWSAGCSSGEEAYSLALYVAQSLPGWQDWDVSILATDINPRALRKARAGVYGAWSFRGMPAALREAYFRRTPQGRWRIDERIASLVSFSYLNLAEDAYPSPVNGTEAMDVIFCRNVLMYFDAARASEVLGKLGRCLVPGGRIFLNPVELSREAVPGLVRFQRAGAFGYQRANSPGAQAVPPLPTLPEPRVTLKGAPERRQRAASAPAAEPRDAGALAQRARACADEGRLAEALAWCERALAADNLQPHWHYLRATILQELGEREQCAAALQRALYLEPRFALAHFALGNVARACGRRDESLRHFRNALSLLAEHEADAALPGADGLSAGRLAEIIALAVAEARAR